MGAEKMNCEPHLCITPPALREAEYLQSEPGPLGCKRKRDEFSLKYIQKPLPSYQSINDET